MFKQGDIREDGFVFRCFYKTKLGEIKAHWLSPEAFIKWKAKRNDCNKTRYHKNLEAERLRNKQYRDKNPHKGLARQAKRRSAKRLAVPKWLTDQQKLEIEFKFLEAKQKSAATGIPHEVDHIEPLQGKDICGLHVPWNLRVIPMTQNRSKGAKRGV